MSDNFPNQQTAPTVVSAGDCPDLRYITGEELEHLRTRLQRAEELLQESRSRIAGATNTGQMDQCHDFVQRIDAFLGESHE